MADLQTIKDRWQNANKVQGLVNVLTMANGTIINGRYILCDSGSVTASHNALQGFAPSEGFPVDVNGCTVNDRDYFRDIEAQEITRNIARCYDSRAIQNPVIVSPDGVVLSGNGRTMAGDIAAEENTDGAYIKYLKEYCNNYGFTLGDVTIFAHPRIVFEIVDNLPYTVETFAMFNAREMKGQSKTEKAIKYGKLVKDDVFGRIVSTINAFETLSDFYACTEASTRCITDLQRCGVIDGMELAEMYDGDTISTTGKETLENVLIGKAFASDPDAARKITTFKSLRKSVVFGLSEVVNNISLGNGYSLNDELSKAIDLAYIARQHGYKAGERVSEYSRQVDAFSGSTVADFDNAIILILADAINASQATMLKRIMAVYNHQAADAAAGQMDIFATGGIKTKEEILCEVRELFAKGSTKDKNEALEGAISSRVNNSSFLTEEQLTQVVKGSYVEFRCKSGDVIVCMVDGIKKGIAYLSGKGGIKLWASVSELVPTSSHELTLPEWIKAGNIITDGLAHQRIEAVCDNSVIFEWLNGGYFDINITTVLQGWRLSESDVCQILEAA